MKQGSSQVKPGRPFAVFDIDGTLIRWQLYHVIVDKLAHEGALGKDATILLKKARLVWKRREHAEAFRSYERTLVQIYESALKHLSTEVFDRFVTEVIDEYKDQTYVYTRNLLKRLQNEGYFTLIISGSHHELIEQIAHYYGFDGWVGTQYARGAKSFSGEKQVASHDKAAALKQLTDKYQLSYKSSLGIGDSGSDAAMLKLVDQPIAFNPDQKLLSEAKTHKWPIVIERKNVIYRLEAENDDYILAQTN